MDEMDKNHREDNSDNANQGKIYERPGATPPPPHPVVNCFQAALPKTPGFS